jgi:hypothetical protein
MKFVQWLARIILAPLIAQWKLEYSKRAFLDAEEIKARAGALLDF